ncbi:threonine synthase [Candidatus Bathyarchaeota archaeon]|nr:threonine synthase [Candidatus Bathyarchaeota archaeon]
MLEFVLSDDLDAGKIHFDNVNSMWRYRSVLPVPSDWNFASLMEGYTPLVKAENLGNALKLRKLYLKDESRNPTGSFRDRAASLMVTWAYKTGFKTLIAASDGNMGVSLAAYAAKTRLNCKVIVPKNVDEGKILQLLIYGSELSEYGTYLDEAIDKVAKLAEEQNAYQATPELNPLSIEAQKTISYETWEQLGEVPDVIVAPVGSGSCLFSIWKGFTELKKLGFTSEIPKFLAVQSEGCAPIVEAFRRNSELVKPTSPETRASAILVRKPAYGVKVLKILREGGIAVSVRDDEIFKAEKMLARFEGLFVEPSSSSTVAALMKLSREGILSSDEKIVCILTGSGLKVPNIFESMSYRKRMFEMSFETSMKFRILTSLSKGEKHGYSIWKSLKGIISPQAVYQHLQDLEKRGYVESFNLNGRRVYKLTEEGKQLLRAFRIIGF